MLSIFRGCHSGSESGVFKEESTKIEKHNYNTAYFSSTVNVGS